VLLASSGGVRIERMVVDHVAEHGTMRTSLGTAETSVLREVLETLRAHLDGEERYFDGFDRNGAESGA